MSSNQGSLLLLGIECSTGDGSVVYQLQADGKPFRFSATAVISGGIRHVEVPEELDSFLWKYVQRDTRVLKRLVNATWQAIDGHCPDLPLDLFLIDG